MDIYQEDIDAGTVATAAVSTALRYSLGRVHSCVPRALRLRLTRDVDANFVNRLIILLLGSRSLSLKRDAHAANAHVYVLTETFQWLCSRRPTMRTKTMVTTVRRHRSDTVYYALFSCFAPKIIIICCRVEVLLVRRRVARRTAPGIGVHCQRR